MIDKRINKMANTIINYCLELKKKQVVIIEGSEITLPLIKEIYKEALKVGAIPEVLLNSPTLNEILYKYADDETLDYLSPYIMSLYEKADASIYIEGNNNTKQYATIDSEKIFRNLKAYGPIMDIMNKRSTKGEFKWSFCQYPTHAAAQDAGMSLDDYHEFIMEACFLNHEDSAKDWLKLQKENERMIHYLKDKSFIEVKAEKVDISFLTTKRKWINSDGKENFPSGEIFTSPIEDSINGTITFSYPCLYMGKTIDKIRLTYKNGELIEAIAGTGQKELEEMLSTDEGARIIGEIGIGTNYGIANFTNNILFDEKIGGTIHLALGRGFKEAGGSNESSIHIDMIYDMRNDGKMYADGELFYENGKFINYK